MEPEALCIYIGPTALGSDIAAAVDSVELTVSETTAAGIQAADAAADLRCVVTDHDPPAVDCFELVASVEVPVVVAPTDGSSRLATRALEAGAETYLDPTTLEAGAAAIAATVDRLSVEQAATQVADDRIEKFSSIVSHELRNPIQKASSGIALAKTQCESEYLDEVEATLSQLDELVANLLDTLDDDVTVEFEAVELGHAVETAWPNASHATLSVEGDLPQIKAEPSRLYQLLENLFRNCVDHGGESVTVRVGPLDAPDGPTGFYVADDGPGIESAHRGDVFEFGYTSSEDGTGLGLAIVDEIATTFGWTVTITDSESGGARFEISQIDII